MRGKKRYINCNRKSEGLYFSKRFSRHILFARSLYGRAVRIFTQYRETRSGRFATIVPSGSYRLAYREEEDEWDRTRWWRQRGRAHATSSSVFKAHWNWWLSHTMTNSLSGEPVPLRSRGRAYNTPKLLSILQRHGRREGAGVWEWDESGKSIAGNEGAYGFYYCIFTLSRLLASTLFTSYRTSSYLPPLSLLALTARYTSFSDPLCARAIV